MRNSVCAGGSRPRDQRRARDTARSTPILHGPGFSLRKGVIAILRKTNAAGLEARFESAAARFDAEVETIRAAAEERERVVNEELASLQLEKSQLNALKAKTD